MAPFVRKSLPLQGLNGSDGSKFLPLSGIANNPISFVNVANGERKKRNSMNMVLIIRRAFGHKKCWNLWPSVTYTFGADVGLMRVLLSDYVSGMAS